MKKGSKKTLCPCGSKVILMFFLFLFMIFELEGQVSVSFMPSNSENVMSGNAILNQSTTIWALAKGGTQPYTFTFKVDGVVIPTNDFVNGSEYYADKNYAGCNYSFPILGKRNITVEVKDANGITTNDQGTIRVHLDPIQQIKVNIAIENGLLHLLKTAKISQNGYVYWDGGGNEYYDLAGSASSILAFEENGHLAKNNFQNDVYSDLLGKALNYLLTAFSGQQSIYDHSDGIQVRNTDLFDEGAGANKGSFLYSQTYANSIALMAVILSQPNGTEAQNTLISAGPFNGWTYYNFILDAFDLLYFNQGDFSLRGSWRYTVTDPCGDSYDGSTQQWPILALKAAKDKWGITAPQWVIDNAMYAYDQITDPSSGGCGYASSSGAESGKTGGMLAAYAWADKLYPNNSQANLSIQFLANNYYLSNDLYVLYAIKKGLELQKVQLLGSALYNWYDDIAQFLLAQQLNDGSWTLGIYGCSWKSISTAFSILVLVKAITTMPPVAIIDEISTQPANSPFQMDGSNSFHTDVSKSIIKWEWDFDDDGVIEATGQRPINPGYSTVGQKKVKLTVTDDSNPALTDSEIKIIEILNNDHPPVAKPIKDSDLPCYAGKVNEEIIIDGSESYDPDNTAITNFYWDLDGDGDCDDETEMITSVQFEMVYNGQIGLTVKSNGVSSLKKYVDVIVSDDDLFVGEVFNTPLLSGDTHINLEVYFHNDNGSSHNFENVLVRLYDENPLTIGNRFGENYLVNLNAGGSAYLNKQIELFDGQDVVYIWLDADQKISEWDEINNIIKFNVIKFGVSDTLRTCQSNIIQEFNLIVNDYSVDYTQTLEAITVQPDCGAVQIIDNESISFQPYPDFFGAFDFVYQTKVFDDQNVFVGFNETTSSIEISPNPEMPFNSKDTIVCPIDSLTLNIYSANNVYQWSTGDTTSEIVVGTTGVGSPVKKFWVNIQNQFGCSISDTITVIFDWSVCTGMSEIIAEYFDIYPNPTNGSLLFIHPKRYFSWLNISLYNQNGIIVRRSNNEITDELNTLAIAGLSEGMYFLNLETDQFSWFIKIIIN